MLASSGFVTIFASGKVWSWKIAVKRSVVVLHEGC